MNSLDIERAMRYYADQLNTGEDRERLRIRAQCAINWIEQHAPEEFRYTLNVAVPKEVKLTTAERAALKELSALLAKQWVDADLHQEFYKIAEKHKITPPEFFAAAYRVLLSKERGPKLAAFLLDIKEHAQELFGQL